MFRSFQILISSMVIAVLTGCHPPKQTSAFWQQVKITDLSPLHSVKETETQLLKTINFNIYTFEIPAENITVMDSIWEMLYTEPIQFNNYDTFIANSFLVGFGQIQMWNKIADLLRKGNGRKTEVTSLISTDGQSNDVIVSQLQDEHTIFYVSTEGVMEGVAIGPGQLSLRIKARKIAGRRGICRVEVTPVFVSPTLEVIPQLDNNAKSGDFAFASVGFKVNMSPGDFVLIGSRKYHSHQITLDSLFFSTPLSAINKASSESKPIISLYLIICTDIMD